MITTTLVTGTLMFEDAAKLPETAKVVIVLEDETGTTVVKQYEPFDSKSLSVFKYLPFELRNFELPEGKRCRISAFVDTKGTERPQDAAYMSREALPIVSGLEDVVLNLARTDA